ncbi:Hypothetical protein FKW44_023119, partial [Caligus rogercresseyi]
NCLRWTSDLSPQDLNESSDARGQDAAFEDLLSRNDGHRSPRIRRESFFLHKDGRVASSGENTKDLEHSKLFENST